MFMQPCGNCRHLLRCFHEYYRLMQFVPSYSRQSKTIIFTDKTEKGRIRVMQSIHIMQTARIEQG